MLLKAKSESAGVAQKLIATSSDLDALAGGDRSVAALKGWRGEVFGEDALRLCRGEIALSAKGGAVRVVIGAIAALRLRSASPLPLYLVSFLPALLALIAINGGQQFAHRTDLSGLILLWAGPVVPAVGAAIGYTRLRRH